MFDGRWIAAACCLGLVGCAGERSEPAVPPAAEQVRYAGVLRELDTELAVAHAQAGRYPQSWGERERVAAVFLQRAQLTGHYEDYAAAETQLNQVRQIAGNDQAACGTQAKLAFALHRLVAATAAIRRCSDAFGLPAELRSELAGMEAEIDLFHGRYDQALARLRALLEEEETIPGLARLSRLHAMTGHRVEALALLDRAERQYFGDSAQLRAWLALQRAVILMEAGRLEDALAFLLAAERHLHGWWLVEEHIAEVKALLGREDEARALYHAIVERTQLPEYMDALATLEEKAGRKDIAQQLIARAEALFRERLARWPEAAAGHALEHWLSFRPDDPETLRLAQANARVRPYGEAQLQLVRALYLSGDLSGARRQVLSILATRYDTAELHAVASRGFDATGEPERAQQERRLALALNPQAVRMFGLPDPRGRQ